MAEDIGTNYICKFGVKLLIASQQHTSATECVIRFSCGSVELLTRNARVSGPVRQTLYRSVTPTTLGAVCNIRPYRRHPLHLSKISDSHWAGGHKSRSVFFLLAVKRRKVQGRIYLLVVVFGLYSFPGKSLST